MCVCVYGKKQAGTLRSQLSSSSRLPCVTDSLRGRGTFNSLEEQTHTHTHTNTHRPGERYNQDLKLHHLRSGRPDCILRSFSLLPAMATLASLLPAPRGIDLNMPTCGETQCNSRGTCVSPPGGGVNLLCDCDLGYQGESCEDTVNGDLSVPLTLGVLGAIIGIVILAFIIAKIRQCQKKNRRKNAAKKFGHDVAV